MLDVNVFDILLLFAGVGIVGLAFVQGVIRQLLYLVSAYIAFVLAAQYHRAFSKWVGLSVTGSDEALAAFAFIAIFLVTLAVLVWLSHHIYNSTLLPHAGKFDNLGGALVGIATAYLVVTVTIAIMGVATSGAWPDWNVLRIETVASMHQSRIVSFVTGQAPLVYGTLRPWMPAGVPSMFAAP